MLIFIIIVAMTVLEDENVLIVEVVVNYLLNNSKTIPVYMLQALYGVLNGLTVWCHLRRNMHYCLMGFFDIDILCLLPVNNIYNKINSL